MLECVDVNIRMCYYEHKGNNNSKISNSKFGFKNVVFEHKQIYKARRNRAKMELGKKFFYKKRSYFHLFQHVYSSKRQKKLENSKKKLKKVNVFKYYTRFPSFKQNRKKNYKTYHKIYSRFYRQKRYYTNSRFIRKARTRTHRMYGDTISGFFYLRRGVFKKRKKGIILRNIRFLRRIFHTVFPQSYVNYLLREEKISVKGPLSNSIDLHLDTPQLALNFHKNLLHQYELYLVFQNKKAQEGFLNLKQYLGSEKYIHDILYSMPGLRWTENEIVNPIKQNIFSDYSYENSKFFQLLEHDLSDMNDLKQLQSTQKIFDGLLGGGYNSFPFHLEESNIKFVLNESYTDVDDKYPVWKAIHRVYFGIRHQLENHHSEYSFLYDWFAYFHFIPFLIYPMIFPAFTTTDKPQRTMSYFKPWTKSPKYIPYMKEIFFRFQKKRALHDIFIKNARRRVSFVTKFIVFSFICFLIFL